MALVAFATRFATSFDHFIARQSSRARAGTPAAWKSETRSPGPIDAPVGVAPLFGRPAGEPTGASPIPPRRRHWIVPPGSRSREAVSEPATSRFDGRVS